jgi:pyruvate formate lyase activating enzyme
MTHIPPTPPETLQRACEIGKKAGLRFVYTDNPDSPETAHTFCPKCSICIIERVAQKVLVRHLGENGACANCGATLGIITSSPAPFLQKGGSS